MATIGKYNALTDVDGIMVGHYTDTDAASGVTVAVCAEGAVAGADWSAGHGSSTTSPAKVMSDLQGTVFNFHHPKFFHCSPFDPFEARPIIDVLHKEGPVGNTVINH